MAEPNAKLGMAMVRVRSATVKCQVREWWQVSVRRTSFFGFCRPIGVAEPSRTSKWSLPPPTVLITVPYVERAVKRKAVHPQVQLLHLRVRLGAGADGVTLEFLPHISPICLPQQRPVDRRERGTVTGWDDYLNTDDYPPSSRRVGAHRETTASVKTCS
ncbi:Serine proteinase stubble-like 8 [Homarus americanus]|uniref:Serine proteinase stubble-like 8 n=1 Tax=Homarus americanus TaxID=6706 RepID=A0A8J5JVI9_HOMAM|nr:Serine proteinase stubble-like 8 [Homarus americanus]